jgi:hypothetical protein
MLLGIVKKYLKSEKLQEILNDNLDLLCNSLDLDMKAYMFILLIFCICNNGIQSDKRLEGSRWWIMAEEAEMPMLWITSHAAVEGRHWSALAKVFGQILSITPSGTDSHILSMTTDRIPLQKFRL